MGYRTRRAFVQRKKKAEDRISEGTIQKTLAKKQVKLSAVDLKILDLIQSRGCLHSISIQANIGNMSEEVVKRHMDRLVGVGVVKAELTNARKRPEIIYFTGKRVPYNEISHTLHMSESLDRILTNPKIILREYKHEHILKSERSKAGWGTASSDLQVPDGEVTLEKDGVTATCFLEIDSKSYTGKALREKVAGLAAYIGNKPLYWICYSSRRLRSISAAVSEYANFKPIMFYELSAL